MALRPRHLRRYRQIAEILTRHGFGAIVAQLDLGTRLNLSTRFLRRKPASETHDEMTLARHVVLALEELGPTFIKLGQILSTRSDLLPPNFIAELSRLQDNVAPAAWPTIKSIIEKELGRPIEQVFKTFETNPIAAASLAQVHAATLPTGDEVVVKVQRPHIEEIIELDLDIIRDLAQLAQERTPLGNWYELVDLAEEFAATLQAELNFRLEGRNADRFHTNFVGEPHLYVPHVYWDYTTRRVLVQERIRGIKIDHIAALEAAGYDRHRIALHSAHFIIKEVLEDGYFHADPHPGNIVVLPGEVIGLMDFGMVGRLVKRDRNNLVRLFIVAVQLDAEGIVDQLQQMGIADYSHDRLALQRDLRRLLVRYHGVPLKEISTRELVEEIEPVIRRHHLRIPSDLWLLIKTLVVMEGVGRALDPDFDMFAVAQPYVNRLIRRLWLPSEWGPSVMRSTANLSELLVGLPRQTTRILGQVERGDFGLKIHIPEIDQATKRLDEIANRVILTVLLAALILALALLIPILNLAWPWSFLTWVIVISFVLMCILALFLIWSILH